MKERTKYEQLQPEDWMFIASMSQQRCSVRAIAKA
jgi:IS30 family transposase